MNWCWRKILVMPVLTCFFSTSISDNTKFSEMKPGERTKAYKISSVKNFCREKGPIEHEDMATRTHSISFWTDQNSRFSVSLNPYFEGVSDRGHNNFHDEMKVSVFMDDIWDFIAMINNSLHFRFSIIAMKKEIIFSVLPFMSMIILFKHDPQSLIAMNRIIWINTPMISDHKR